MQQKYAEIGQDCIFA